MTTKMIFKLLDLSILGSLIRTCVFVFFGLSVTVGVNAQSFTVNSTNVINVSSYGAIPNDGIDDEDEINAAIAAAGDNAIIRFEAGTYTLRAADNRFGGSISTGHILVSDKKDITLEGAVEPNGEPATHIERILAYPSLVSPPSILWGRRNDGIKVIHMTFDNKNYHMAVGEVVSINSSAVTVEVLDGYPVINNTPCAVVNAWEWDGDPLTTERLKIGLPSLSYTNSLGNMSIVSGRQMTLASDLTYAVDVGDYISWHYETASIGTVNFRVNKRVWVENVHIYNGLRSMLFFAYNQDIYVKDAELRPKSGRFCATARDGIHSSRNIGEYIVENLYVKGTRLDGYVAAGTAATVSSIIDSRTFQFETDARLAGGNSFGTKFGDGNGGNTQGMVCLVRPVYFFQNGLRHKIETQRIAHISSNSGERSFYEVVTQEDLPSFVGAGTVLSPAGLSSDTVVVANSRFSSIAGSGQVLFCDNTASVNNTYENLMYSAIRYGANQSRNHAGVNHRVANSNFTDCGWEFLLFNPADEVDEYGYINSFNANTQGRGFEHMDVGNILIEDNTFTSNYASTGSDPGKVGILLDEAYDITIQNNTFNGIAIPTEMRDVQGVVIIDNSITSGSTYRLENGGNGKYLRGYDPNSTNKSENNAFVTVYNDAPTWSTQKWVITEFANQADRYEIKNIYSDRALRGYDPSSTSPAVNGAKVTVRDPIAWSTMMWEFIPIAGQADTYYIKNNSSGLYLKGASANNEYVTQSSSNASLETRWTLFLDSSSARLYSDEFALKVEDIQGSLSVFPNPTSDQINIVGSGLKGATIELTDLSGKSILQKKLTEDNSSVLKLDVVQKGIYFLKVTKGEGELMTSKIIVE